ncbi:FAD-binding oxidoreductase [Loigolactobacillus rennini]|uniref:Glycolate oxidase n=1 Tax=Loigolactobacillus rennini DSM 20253 TaxID=1423796 RepID=A0A0R2CNA3_9LACO|nr:FAD-binding oxidoreductase [Loigolactobacillus rennini]KRM93054.1 glycolate oxidase [Loigolactobacillus rennini DSM 20253]
MDETTKENFLKALTKVIPPDRLYTEDEISDDYGHDEINTIFHLPEFAVKPMTTKEVATVMQCANENNISVVVRGAGTGLVGGAIPTTGGLLLDLSGMNEIKQLDTDNLTLTVEPGALLTDIKQYTETRGFFYPPDPGEKTATIGGNISTNAGGMRAIKYGVTRDYVRGLTVVTALGNVMHLGGKFVKNSSGFDLKDMIIGSEGTLGVITEITLKIIIKPEVTMSLLVPFPNFKDAIKAVPNILRSGITPTAVEFFEQNVIKYWESFSQKIFPEDGHQAYLLLSFDGQKEAQIEDDYEKIAELCLEHGAEDVYVLDDVKQQEEIWSARGAFLEAIKDSTTEMDEVDIVVPRSEIVSFVQYVHQIATTENIRIPGFGHAGDGNLHFYVCRDDYDQKTWQEKLTKVFDALYQESKTLGGQVSGEHGIGIAKKVYLRKSLDEVTYTAMKKIKQVFDPNNILNPDKIL